MTTMKSSGVVNMSALSYNDLEKSYIAQMEVSDDSDVEACPLYFDKEDGIKPIDMGRGDN